jgi:hypothetical protein
MENPSQINDFCEKNVTKSPDFQENISENYHVYKNSFLQVKKNSRLLKFLFTFFSDL